MHRVAWKGSLLGNPNSAGRIVMRQDRGLASFRTPISVAVHTGRSNKLSLLGSPWMSASLLQKVSAAPVNALSTPGGVAHDRGYRG
jgi:hypothetical protein